MGRNTHKRNAEEPFRSHFRNLQGVKLLPLLFRQDLLGCPAQGSQVLATKGDCPELVNQIEEVPLRFLDFLAKSVPIEILDNSPAGQEGLAFSNRRNSGKSVPSLIRMVPVLMVSGIWALLGVYSGTSFGSIWRQRFVVSAGLSLCN